MDAFQSKLRHLDFRVLESSLQTIEVKGKQGQLISLENLPLEFDFTTANNNQNSAEFAFSVNCLVNMKEKPAPGYQIKVRAVGVFHLDVDSLSPEELQNFKILSPLSLMIGNIRGFVRDITSYGIFGSYQIPSIDIIKLVLEKSKKVKATRKISDK
jgi:preprotein translocase subunit SecB